MDKSKAERKAVADFGGRYAARPPAVVERLESEVIGEVWGANGYTTVDQAEGLVRRLNLGPGKRLLDVGTGCGWPGLYLAKRTGCEVALTDLPREGLEVGVDRARRERLDLLGAFVATARHLPVGPETFDAVVHTDVIC